MITKTNEKMKNSDEQEGIVEINKPQQKTVGICSEPFDSNLVFDFDLSSPTNPTTTKDENDMTAKNHKNLPQPAMRGNQTPEPTDDQYGLFTEEEVDTLILRACKHGATKEEVATFLAWANKARINAALLDLIQRGDLEISGYKDDGTAVMDVPDRLGGASKKAGAERRQQVESGDFYFPSEQQLTNKGTNDMKEEHNDTLNSQ